MPGAITHYLVGLETLNHIKYPISPEEMPFFKLGLQGPDLLFFNNIVKANKITTLGHDMHKKKKIYQTFDAMLQYITLTHNKYILTYILGYICHYALDCTTHPYINAKAHNIMEHRDFETKLDYLMLQTTYCSNQFSQNNQCFKVPLETIQSIQKLYTYIAHNVYKVSCPSPNILISHIIMRSSYCLFDDHNGYKKRIITKFEDFFGLSHSISAMFRCKYKDSSDILNINHAPWQHNGQLHKESFYDLLTQTINFSTQLIIAFLNTYKTQASLPHDFSKSFATGMQLNIE